MLCASNCLSPVVSLVSALITATDAISQEPVPVQVESKQSDEGRLLSLSMVPSIIKALRSIACKKKSYG